MPAPIDPARLARLQVVGAAALFSTGGAAIKSTSYTGIRGGLEVASLRSGVAAAAIAALLPGARRNWTRRTWIVGAAYAATVILFVLANKETTAANAIFLQSTAPLYVLLAGVVAAARARARRRRRRDAGDRRGTRDGRVRARRTRSRPPRARRSATRWRSSPGVTWAGTLLGLRWIGREEGGVDAAAGAAVAGNLIAFVVCLPWALPPTGDAQDWVADRLPGRRADRARLHPADGGRAPRARVRGLAAAAGGARPEPGLGLARARRDAQRASPSPAAALILGATAVKVWLDWRRAPAAAALQAPPAAPP